MREARASSAMGFLLPASWFDFSRGSRNSEGNLTDASQAAFGPNDVETLLPLHELIRIAPVWSPDRNQREHRSSQPSCEPSSFRWNRP